MNGIESNSSVNISKFFHYMFLRLLSLEIFACFLGFLVGTCSSILQIILYVGTQSSSDLLVHLYKSLFFLSINVISTSLSSSSMPIISPTYHFFSQNAATYSPICFLLTFLSMMETSIFSRTLSSDCEVYLVCTDCLQPYKNKQNSKPD